MLLKQVTGFQMQDIFIVATNFAREICAAD